MKKALKRLDGVQDVEVSLETQSARVTLRPGERLDAKKLREAIKKADFTAGTILLEASGPISANTDEKTSEIADLVLKLPDSGQIFLLVKQPAAESEEKGETAESTSQSRKLRQSFNIGDKKFLITGQVHEHKEFPHVLTVQEFEAIGGKN